MVALICICFFTACSRKDEPEYAPVEETQASPADTSDGLGEDTKYKIEDFVEIKDLPENVIWTEGAEPLGYIGVEPKPLVGETLKKVIENVGEEVYIGVFVKNFTSCGLVPQIRYGIEIFPEEVIADDNFLKLFIAANNSYEEYSKTAGELLAQGLKVYEIFVIEEFNRARDKAKDAYNAYYEYAGQLCKDMVFKYPNKEDYYEELHHTILKNHHIGMMETRNLFFSSFGFIPYY
ncbi:MAG: hypothetical protein IKU45_01945, partial [Clostridia bacterium]|nr:hypothetical protein [Clostridia bacterium]